MIANRALHIVVDWWLGVLRVAVLVLLSPLLLPALALRFVGSGTASLVLTALLLPFMLMWVAARTGYRVTRSVATTVLTLPYDIIVAPYRFLRILTKPHGMSDSQWTA